MEIKLANCCKSIKIDSEDLNRLLSVTDKFYGLFNKYDEVYRVCYNHPYFFKKPTKYGTFHKTIGVASLILNYFGNLQIDHIDKNPLNNKKENLRIVTHGQNQQNKIKNKNIKYTSKYKGVSFAKQRNRWKSQIDSSGEKIFGGYFKTEIQAAKHSNILMQIHHKEFAVLNTILEDN